MYYDKTVDLTSKARKRRSHEIPGKDANTPSEELTEFVEINAYTKMQP